MTLRVRFALLLGLLALTLVGTVTGAFWSFGMLRRELAEPFVSSASVLEGLGRIKRNLEEQANILYGYGPTGQISGDAAEGGPPGAGIRNFRPDREPPVAREEDALAYSRLRGQTIGLLDELDNNQWYIARVGRTATRSFRAGLSDAERLASNWFSHENQDDRVKAGRAKFELHEFIERIEGRILVDADMAIIHGEDVRWRLITVLLFVLIAAGLMLVLAFALQKRWLQDPVARLREAAARIAAGDFQHRVPVAGRDELAVLSHEVNHMASMVEQMQVEAVQRERLAAVGEMVRRITHNLRSPLSGIRALAEVSRMDTEPESDLRENQDQIIASVDRFESWLSDLLNVTGPLEVRPERCLVAKWAADVVSAHQASAKAKRVEIRIDINIQEAEFDRHHMEHAVSALLANAVYYAPEDSQIILSCQACEDGQFWEIRITDHGPGVPVDLRERIFQPHFTRRPNGSGIGLAVVHHVVLGHGGRVHVEPTLRGPELGNGSPEGATFVIRLPLVGGGLDPEVAENSRDEVERGEDPGR